jgi:hypothetical protein
LKCKNYGESLAEIHSCPTNTAPPLSEESIVRTEERKNASE